MHKDVVTFNGNTTVSSFGKIGQPIQILNARTHTNTDNMVVLRGCVLVFIKKLN
jgi:hypothetical protein